MNNMFINNVPSVVVNRATLNNFEAAFNNLKPRITTQGNFVKIQQRGSKVQIPLSQPVRYFGFTR